MERKKQSKGSVWEFCYANKIFGTFGFEMKVCGQKLVKFCAHTHAAQLVVRMIGAKPHRVSEARKATWSSSVLEFGIVGV